MNAKEIKCRLILFCKQNKIKQKTLALGANTTPATISRWLDLGNDVLPTLSAVCYLAGSHNLDANWLLKGESK